MEGCNHWRLTLSGYCELYDASQFVTAPYGRNDSTVVGCFAGVTATFQCLPTGVAISYTQGTASSGTTVSACAADCKADSLCTGFTLYDNAGSPYCQLHRWSFVGGAGQDGPDANVVQVCLRTHTLRQLLDSSQVGPNSPVAPPQPPGGSWLVVDRKAAKWEHDEQQCLRKTFMSAAKRTLWATW